MTSAADATRGRWLRFGRYLALWVVTTAVLAYAAAAGWLWARQESLLFRPSVLAADHVLARAADVTELALDVPGARLSMLRLSVPQARGVVFYLHGNAGSLQRWFTDLDFYRQAGFDLVMMDYRGFGKSSGRIESQPQLLDDVRAAWARVAGDYRGRRVVLVGRSLGSGLAAALAADLAKAGTPADLTVLISPYTSMRALAAEQYPWAPVAPLLRYPLPTGEWLARVPDAPLLIAHGDADALIPVAHARALHAQHRGSQLVVVAGGTHSNVQDSAAYRAAMAAALARLR